MVNNALKVQTAVFNSDLRADALLVPALISRNRPVVRINGLAPKAAERLRELLRSYHGGADVGAIDAHLTPAGAPFRRLAVVSLGKNATATLDDIRKAAASATRWCAQNRLASIAVDGDALAVHGDHDALAAWTEAVFLTQFRYDKLRSRQAAGQSPRRSGSRLRFAFGAKPAIRASAAIARAAIVAEAVNLARHYAHEPPNVINPVSLAEVVRAKARETGLKCRVLDQRQLAALRMNAMLAVGRGSRTPARLIVLEHAGSKPKAPPIVLVGKAVTHDTGGYSIKPLESMPEMKFDKCGGMAVLGTLVAAARLKLPHRVIGIIAAAENMIGGDAYRPGDILTAMNGKTIEVLSTDAEGRLVLADALCYAQRFYKPRTLIDLATLTGACVVALGHHAAGLFANDDELAANLSAAGDLTGDRVWRMPLWNAYRRQIEGVDSDLKNTGGRPGGSITAAMFLKEFVDDKVPWAHLDIAGVAHMERETYTNRKGATGFGVRLLLRYLEQQSA